MRNNKNKTMKYFVLIIIFFVCFLFCLGDDQKQFDAFDTVLIVLGNEPLDDTTPTVDMISRVKTAVKYQMENPRTLLIFTGGATAGTNSEARMMADIAIKKGAVTNMIHLEERGRSTQDHARLTAAFLEKFPDKKIIIVSKKEHLEWAMHVFKRHPIFKNAEELASPISTDEIIKQMEEYLKTHDNARVRKRLQQIRAKERGTD